jgi:predicted ArsR family transcriptional regulator
VKVNRRVLRAVFTEDWQSVSQLAEAASMTPQGVRVHIREALRDGVCESRLVKSTKQWGRSEQQYRVSP